MISTLLYSLCIFSSESSYTGEGQPIIFEYPQIMTFLSAELFLLLTRRSDIMTLLKNNSQKTQKEKLYIERGLRRACLLDALVFVPASVLLFYMLIFPLVKDQLLQFYPNIVVWHAAGGIAAYEFPFAAVSKVIKRLALHTLREFGTIITEASTGNCENHDKEPRYHE